MFFKRLHRSIPRIEPGGEAKGPMDVRIKASVEFTVTGSALEDALAEFDELSVEGLLREIIDKAIASDDIRANVLEGPNTLEEYDQQLEQTRSQG
jgi:hypothetical protein